MNHILSLGIDKTWRRPMLLSRADVIHEPMPRLEASRVHSRVPETPPCRVGFHDNVLRPYRIKKGGAARSGLELTPISSSSRAMGTGVRRQRSAITSQSSMPSCCSHCEMNVKNRIGAIPGVKEVAASAPLGKVAVTATAEVTDQMVKDAITAAGYTVVEE